MINQFKLIVPFYNAGKYLTSCIGSIQKQNYPHYKCILIDDASTDNSNEIAFKLIKNDNRFILIKNSENKKAIFNVIQGINKICNNDNDIIVFIDGDDWLIDNSVLSFLNKIYQNNDILLTYGQYITLSDFQDKKIIKGSNEPLHDIKDTRNSKKNFSHLKTCKYLLWKKLNDQDLRRWDGKYIQRAWDFFMRILIKIAGLGRIRYVDKILYVYNNENPLNEYKLNEQEQLQETEFICKQNRKDKIV